MASPGAVEIHEATIVGQRGVVDISPLMLSAEVYENVKAPGIVAKVAVLENASLATALPINGEEYLRLTFSTPSMNEVSYFLRLTAMGKPQVQGSGGTKTYELTAVSPEVFTHKRTQVQKSYNTNIHSAVQDIVKTYLGSSKSVFTNATNGIQKYIVSNKKPFQAIHELRKRAASTNWTSSAYVFYEDQDGYNFVTLEYLLSLNSVAQYRNDFSVSQSVRDDSFWNILAIEHLEQFDTARKTGEGAFAVNMAVFDFKTMQYSSKVVQPNFSSLQLADKNRMSTDAFVQEQGQTPARTMYVTRDAFQPDTYVEDFTPNLITLVSELDQNKIRILVNGNSELKAGNCIDLGLLEATAKSGDKDQDTLISGKYLITGLVHCIAPASAKPRYTCAIECAKGSYRDPLKQ